MGNRKHFILGLLTAVFVIAVLLLAPTLRVTAQTAPAPTPAVNRLPVRESDVLTRLFGLDGHDPENSTQIARSMNISRDRVEKIKDRALTSLQYDDLVKQLKAA